MARVDRREVLTPDELVDGVFEEKGDLEDMAVARGGEAVMTDGIDENSDSDQLDKSPRVSLSSDNRGADSAGGPRKDETESEDSRGVEISGGRLTFEVMAATSAGGMFDRSSSSTPDKDASAPWDL